MLCTCTRDVIQTNVSLNREAITFVQKQNMIGYMNHATHKLIDLGFLTNINIVFSL